MTSNKRANIPPRRTGNPFIDRLPSLLAEDVFSKRFRQVPFYEEEMRQASNEARLEYLLDILTYTCPLTRHYDLYLSIWQMLRHGYLMRDPTDPDFWPRWRVKMLALREDLSQWNMPKLRRKRPRPFVASPFDASLFGLSGNGKSTSEGRILRMFPQVIEHPRFNIRQLVWAEMETSTQSSTKDMLISAMAAVDDALGTSYALRFGKGEEYHLLFHVINIFHVNAVGLLVSDELQNLTNLKSRGADAILGFLLRLTNESKTPMMAMGTYEAEKMMKTLRMKRRWWRAGTPEWKPLDRQSEYMVFLAGLWPLQYTRDVTVRSPELEDRLYEESQGIPDYVVRLYILAQKYLIVRNDGGKRSETITPTLLSQIAREYLGPAHAVLQALRARDTELLKSLDDVELPPISQLITHRENSSTAAGSPKKPSSPTETSDSDEPTRRARPHTARNTSRNHNSVSPSACELLTTVGDGIGKPDVAHDRLRSAGVVKSGVEFWE
ncbi:TniB family NTP-binding protein [Occallatibacter riparius]|uniref:TniB family NTP-binding protein n=1 Tax=Occallatibacter riparius TaxID=1002689 RepID=A0A9J7BW85_9BACT|nr:TniB family NTP-binding protein [Occallatibacter riparius]UWZ85150.1 TniB family NTP-binding protein [Occallatibacter riparius]